MIMPERAHPDLPGFKNKFFGLIKNKYRQKLFERYHFCNEFVKGRKVLDIPCGVGWGTSLLKRAAFIIGIDISNEAIDYAKKHYENKNRKFYSGLMQSIPLENDSIDVVLCLEGFEHVTKNIGAKFIEESKRVLRQEGLLIMTCPVLNEYGKPTGNPYHLCEYAEYELIEILNRNFRILSLDRIDGPDGPEYRAVLSNIKVGRYKTEKIE